MMCIIARGGNYQKYPPQILMGFVTASKSIGKPAVTMRCKV
jgi:hypothetical protein